MAVYEGARPRSTTYPRRRLEAPLLRPQAPAIPRRRSRVVLHSRRHPRFFGVAIGLIAIAFLLSFFSLVQTVRVSASDYDMSQLDQQFGQLQNERQQKKRCEFHAESPEGPAKRRRSHWVKSSR